MNVIVLGGAGDMGSRAVEDLAATEGVERVTIADRNVAAAERLAASLAAAPAKVVVKAVDATDHSGLVEAMRGHDVAASALGPFFRFERPLVRAAIAAGVDYASICDDWIAAKTVLDELAREARAAGRTVLTGLGASPGLTNVGIRYFADRMEKLRRVEISVHQPLDAGGGEAVLRHMLFIISGSIECWRSGRALRIPACSESREVEFPHFGRQRVWNMGHAEPVTVPRFLPGVEDCTFFMGFGRPSPLLVQPARWGLFRSERVVDWAVRLGAAAESRFGHADPSPAAVRLDLWGVEGGAQVHRMACGVGQMREVTALSLSVGAAMVGRKEILEPEGGVWAPEALLDPRTFLERMRAKGVQAYEDLAMQRPVEPS
ncbi:MAG: saccharopine dehydrogenase NADP-binding domain-containing protein [Deltaproteobacteria bacterium]|nr:saccharopine dehydrogenase NADP-binding domain-containing protein [Deltaproteobacteria bacterium]